MRTGRLLTNYCHRQNRLGLEKINLTYCPLIREQNNENWKLKTPSLHPQFFFQAHLQSWFFSPHSFRWCRATGVCNAQSLPLLPHTFPLLQPVFWGSSHRIPSFMNWPYTGSGSRSSPTQVHSSECSPAGTGCSSMGPTQLPIQAACSILGSSPASSKPNPPAAVWGCSRGSNGVPQGLFGTSAPVPGGLPAHLLLKPGSLQGCFFHIFLSLLSLMCRRAFLILS